MSTSLIVGVGPAGVSLGCFLAQNGTTTHIHPFFFRHNNLWQASRASCLATVECLRDLGIEHEAIKHGNLEKTIGPWYRFSNTMTSGELLRRFAFGSVPDRQGALFEASPCQYLDLPQRESEPLLMKYATQHGFKCRNDVEFVCFEQDNDGQGSVTTTLKDLLTKQVFRVKSKYLCGADGANSKVARMLALPTQDAGISHLAMNVMVECDLSSMVGKQDAYTRGLADSSGLLHSVYAWDKPTKDWAVAGLFRAVVPYKEWLVILLSAPDVQEISLTTEEIRERIYDFLGDDSIPVKIGKVSQWRITEVYAEQVSRGNVFCLGDSIHRHSPAKGLGSNTCIQDAYNLAWKLSHVIKGIASPSLLDTYQSERQPIAKSVVSVANETFHAHFAMYAAMGILQPTPEARIKAIQSLADATPEAAARRAAISVAQEALEAERACLGSEMNVTYETSSAGIFLADESSGPPVFATDPTFHYHESTYPGFRLPHAWLGTKRMGEMLSTQDLAGKARWTLFTGIGGTDTWTFACKGVEEGIPGLEIECFTIGWGQQYTDILEMWTKKRGVSEDGAVLVKPDRYVAWRCQGVKDVAGESEAGKNLMKVLKHILGR